MPQQIIYKSHGTLWGVAGSYPLVRSMNNSDHLTKSTAIIIDSVTVTSIILYSLVLKCIKRQTIINGEKILILLDSSTDTQFSHQVGMLYIYAGSKENNIEFTDRFPILTISKKKKLATNLQENFSNIRQSFTSLKITLMQ